MCSSLFAAINQGISNKKIMVKVCYSKSFLNFLFILQENGFIRTFYISKDKKCIFVYLKYENGFSVIRNGIKPILTSFSYKKLKSHFRKSNHFGIVATNKGFCTVSKCLLLKSGGVVLCVID